MTMYPSSGAAAVPQQAAGQVANGSTTLPRSHHQRTGKLAISMLSMSSFCFVPQKSFNKRKQVACMQAADILIDSFQCKITKVSRYIQIVLWFKIVQVLGFTYCRSTPSGSQVL